MASLEEIPFVMHVAEWAWGSDLSEEVSPEICLREVPFLSMGCFSALFTKVLGVMIILGACLTKVPVIKNILDSKSVAGFPASSLYLDIIVCTNSATYGFLNDYPFTAYGENVGLTIQCIIIALLMWEFKDDPKVSMTHRIVAAVAYMLYSIFIGFFMPLESSYLLMTTIWPLLLYARGSQVWEVYRIKHTGSQSLLTTIMTFGGSGVRIITTIKEVGWDFAVLGGFFLSVFVNGIILFQFWLYHENTKKFFEEQQKKKRA